MPQYLNFENPAIKWFLRKNNYASAEEGVIAEAQQLASEYKRESPPFIPEELAPFRNIKQITKDRIHCDGMLIPLGGGFIIKLNQDQERVRQRFSCAHEIIHTFFFDLSTSPPSQPYAPPKSNQGVESLCDLGAGELLMPKESFKEIVRKYPIPSIEALKVLANLFDVSIQAFSLKIVRGLQLWKAAIINWKWMPEEKTGLRSNLRIEWSACSPGYWIPIKDSVSSNSGVLQAFQSNKIAKGAEKISIGNLKGEYWVESAPFTKKNRKEVISVIPLDYKGESLTKLNEKYPKQPSLSNFGGLLI